MDYIKQLVKELVEEHGTNDPYCIALDMGIDIDEYPFNKRINGMIYKITGKTVIVLNSNLPALLKKFVLAHELGHQLLSPVNTGYFFLTEYTLLAPNLEREATMFAVELLMWGEKIEHSETIEHLARRVGIPVEVLIKCIHNISL